MYDSFDFSLSVLGRVGVEMTTEDDIPEGEPGNSVTYTVEVENMGNGPDTFTLSAEGAYKNWVKLERLSVPLAYEGKLNIHVTIQIPDDATYGSYNVTVKAKSTEDEDISTDIRLQVDVLQVVEFTASIDDNSLEGLPGENITYEMDLENLGNIMLEHVLDAVLQRHG